MPETDCGAQGDVERTAGIPVHFQRQLQDPRRVAGYRNRLPLRMVAVPYIAARHGLAQKVVVVPAAFHRRLQNRCLTGGGNRVHSVKIAALHAVHVHGVFLRYNVRSVSIMPYGKPEYKRLSPGLD